MPRVRRRPHTLRGELTSAETLELILGPTGGGFANDTEREAAWWAHREALLADANPTTRPWGFWEYEQGGRHPRHGKQAATLAELGMLTPVEESLIRRWQI